MKKYLLIAAATLFTTATVTASVLASKEVKSVTTKKECTRANAKSDVVKAEKKDCAKMERTHCFD